MIYVIIYGLLALGTLCISIAPKTKSLWKVGIIFFVNWVITITIYSSFSLQAEAALSLGTDTFSACVCFMVSTIYQCKICKYVTCIYSVQACLYGYMLFSGNSYVTHVALNALFILNALIIIFGGSRILLSKDRRWHDLTCYNNDRRINSRKRNQKFEAHYV